MSSAIRSFANIAIHTLIFGIIAASALAVVHKIGTAGQLCIPEWSWLCPRAALILVVLVPQGEPAKNPNLLRVHIVHAVISHHCEI